MRSTGPVRASVQFAFHIKDERLGRRSVVETDKSNRGPPDQEGGEPVTEVDQNAVSGSRRATRF
jgi:hypothetical protein